MPPDGCYLRAPFVKPTTVFSSKAEKYARYRWRYAAQAVQTITEVTGINRESRAADIGAGTGILTRELTGSVGLIYAVEPNPEMRAVARRELAAYPSCRIVDGRAEATTLEDGSLDLVTAAQATHWFEPRAARKEIRRILKPGGWLAILRNYDTDRELGLALEKIFPAETDTAVLKVGDDTPRFFYYEGRKFERHEFPFTTRQPWETFFGSLCTASYAPDEGSPLFASFEASARQVFQEFSAGGSIEQHGVTELYLGQVLNNASV